MSTDYQPAKFFDIHALLAGANGRSILTHKAVDDDALERTSKSRERWSSINNGQHNEKRSSQRLPYLDWLVVVVEPDISSEESKEEMICFEAWGYDISSGGASFLCPETLIPINCINESETHLQLNWLVKARSSLAIGLEKESGGWLWLSGRVTHLREIQDGFIGIGVKFVVRGE